MTPEEFEAAYRAFEAAYRAYLRGERDPPERGNLPVGTVLAIITKIRKSNDRRRGGHAGSKAMKKPTKKQLIAGAADMLEAKP